MIYEIALPNIPNGSGSFDLDEVSFDFTFRTLRDGSMCCDITITTEDSEMVIGGRKCVNSSPLLLESPFASGKGNLYFYDKFGNENPTYDKLNERFVLIYDSEYDFEKVTV